MRWNPWLVLLLSSCASPGPVLESTRVSYDMLHAKYRGSCGQPKLSWDGTLDPVKHTARLALTYDNGNGDAEDCTHEAQLELWPIRKAASNLQQPDGNVKLLVPNDLGNNSFTVVDYAVPIPSCLSSTAPFASSAGDNFALSRGLDFTSCGRQERAFVPACCATASAGYDCLVAALDTCSPARLGEVYGTVEGAAIFTDYFVVPRDRGCELVVVTDNGQDGFRDTSSAPVLQRHCRLARTRAAASADTCPSLQLDACVP